jgi:hypothetical protein
MNVHGLCCHNCVPQHRKPIVSYGMRGCICASGLSWGVVWIHVAWRLQPVCACSKPCPSDEGQCCRKNPAVSLRTWFKTDGSWGPSMTTRGTTARPDWTSSGRRSSHFSPMTVAVLQPQFSSWTPSPPMLISTVRCRGSLKAPAQSLSSCWYCGLP